MRVRAAAALGAMLCLATAASGCGGSDASVGKSALLKWKEPPAVVVPPTLPRDRILRGEIENAGLKKIKVEAADLKLLDAGGRAIDNAAAFLAAYAHALYPYGRGPGRDRSGLPESERRRVGLAVELKPGQSAPLTISWHEPPGRRTPVKIDYGEGTIEVPPEAEKAKPSEPQSEPQAEVQR